MSSARAALFGLCVLLVAQYAAAACTVGQPRLLLTGVAGAGCASDPITQCLSDVSFDLTATCGITPDADSLPAASTTVQIQSRWVAGNKVTRNVMSGDFPYIGDDVYDICYNRVNATSVSGASGDAALEALFNAVDFGNAAYAGAGKWSIAAGGAASTIVASNTQCQLTYTVLADDVDVYKAINVGDAGTFTEAAFDATIVSGTYAAIINNGSVVTETKSYVLALCPSGTFSTKNVTIETGCDNTPQGSSTNKVGALSATDVTACPAGTFAAEGAGQCRPCAKDMFAPFIGMDVCAECKDAFAPIQGSTRCIAGFGGRVLVVEGQSVVGNKVYDPSGAVAKVYGDDSQAVLDNAIFPDAKTKAGGSIWSYITDENTDDKVPQLGGPLDGWATIQFAPSATAGTNVNFTTTCIGNSVFTSGVLVSEDATGTLSMLGSTACGQINGVIDDLSAVPAGWTATPNFQNLTLSYASPTELIAFGQTAGGKTVTISVTVKSGATVTLAQYEDSTDAASALTGTYARDANVLANTFGATVVAAAPNCPAGTSYVEKADSSGFTFSKQCRPCPDGYACPKTRTGLSPVAAPCKEGTRGTVFGATTNSSCVACAVAFYQDSPGSMTCDACAAITTTGAKSCPTACPDGQEGNPKVAPGCTNCTAGTYRSGDMPSCITCPAGNEVWATSAAGVDGPINANTTEAGEDCKPCGPGYYSSPSTSAAAGSCTACPIGTYGPRGGLSACISCPKGTWQNSTASTSCKKAVKGSYVDFVGATNNTKLCPKGYFGEVAGAISLQTGCKKCKPGTFANTDGATTCNTCKTGFYQDKSAQQTCTQCPAGTINTALGSSTCTVCAPGSFSAKGASTCTKCPAGTFQDKAKQSGCKPCPAGSFCTNEGLTKATKCPVGTFGPRPNGSSQRLACLPCAKNTATTGATKC